MANVMENRALNALRRHVTGAIERGEKQPILEQRADWQTQARGTNAQEYEIYVAAAKSLGWRVKTYDEWVNS
ncbi:hypothetical protein [Castellaniella sp.]|uniref:hypothetical protein n=1 Tax=Castellaniella sp. TaxID=1955812 RepID=UPI002B000095|nr:hypothetical protein [Castellaniella sp.]